PHLVPETAFWVARLQAFGNRYREVLSAHVDALGHARAPLWVRRRRVSVAQSHCGWLRQSLPCPPARPENQK
ncbi:hypothetical protein N9K98_01540, partial [Luminiphilus sp.]|nr:hypothetical protein [Luminiphilus sp.]